MAGILPDRILKHTATPVSYLEDESSSTWIEGERGVQEPEPIVGAPFKCVLFMPGPGGRQDSEYRPRTVRAPTLLYNPTRPDRTPVVVLAENELSIDAPELAPWIGGVSPARFQCDGDPQPFGPPGRVFGLQATLRLILD